MDPSPVATPAPGAGSAPVTVGGLYQRLLLGESRDRLLALRAATEANAATYLAILAVFVAARERYEVEIRTDRVAADLAAAGVVVDNLERALDQLREWGNLTWTQDTARVSRLEDFRRRRALWQLTAAGQAAYDAVVAVLDASDQAGSLQRSLFRDIRENLALLAEAVDARDADRVYLRLRDLDGSLRDLAVNARDFHAAVALLRREHDVDPDRFLAYKDLLIDYLEQFLDHLVTQRALVARAVTDVEARGLDVLVGLAAAGDDSGGLFDDGDRAERWRQRWRGLSGWFVAGAEGPAGADELVAATTTAISDLLSLLRQVTERARRPISRASELVVLARWFRRLPSDAAAAELFDAAFGLGRPLHVSGDAVDPEQTPATASWWSAPPVPVPVTLREHGRRPSPGRAATAADYSATKARLAAEHRAAQAARAEAAARLRARPVEGRVLSEPELVVLLELLDRAAHQRPVAGTVAAPVAAPAPAGTAAGATGPAPAAGAPVVIEGTSARLVADSDGMTVRTTRGILTLTGHRLAITDASTTVPGSGASAPAVAEGASP